MTFGSNQLASVLMLVTCLLATSTIQAQSDGIVDFDHDIRPIFNDHCASCHGGVKKSGGFTVLTAMSLIGEDGAPIIPGDADQSELMRRVTSDDVDERMPPADHDPLSDTQIAKLHTWINQGAHWPTHWAYSPLRPGQPAAVASVPISSTIDAWINAQLAEYGIEPSPRTDRRTLIRRLSLDLTGLLPEFNDVEAFVADQSDDAYDRLVDRLLASPHFGERWARHWLDEARYADSEGYEKDTPKNDAYRLRDWVIDAINRDMPFDQFTIKQMAGDLLPDHTPGDLIATKFHLQTQFNLEGGVDAEEDRTKRVIDRVGTIGSVWLGMSIGCCQCHDHPYDAPRQRDFYALYAFFNNADFTAALLPPTAASVELDKKRGEKSNALSSLLKKQVSDKNLSSAVQGKLSDLRNFDNSNGFTRFLRERADNRRKTYVFRRGDFLRPITEDGEIAANVPEFLPPLDSRGGVPDRLDLAHWLARRDNPLVARVAVNKIWMHLFGKPLVGQPQEFGARGDVPTHPELLDWLAHCFVTDGNWSRKNLIRRIVRSNAYQRSSAVRPDLLSVDPDNHLLARQNRFRVEAEIVRDISLQSGALLSRKVGGPSVFPPLPKIIAKQTYAGSFRYSPSVGEDRYRRGLYTFFRRTAIDPNLATFDCPDASITRSRRDRSNNPLQALATLQNEVYHEAAQCFAKRILLHEGTDEDRLALACSIALSRQPNASESRPMLELLNDSRDWYKEHRSEASKLVEPHGVEAISFVEHAAWIATLRVILNLDEFITRS